MTDRTGFTALMAALATALPTAGRPITEATYEIYWRALSPTLTDDEFHIAAEKALLRCRFFPVPSELLEFARPPRADLRAEAVRVMNAAWWDCREYDPETGTFWRGNRLLELYGEAAYEAFHACGGSAGFLRMDDAYHGPRIRREFQDCYERVVREEPEKALPPAAEPDRRLKLLPR